VSAAGGRSTSALPRTTSTRIDAATSTTWSRRSSSGGPAAPPPASRISAVSTAGPGLANVTGSVTVVASIGPTLTVVATDAPPATRSVSGRPARASKA
jgi:hypothetical protein